MSGAAPQAAPWPGSCMRTSRPSFHARQRGFSYLLLLFVIAISSAALGALAESVQIGLQRELEAELLFRGHEFSRALDGFRSVRIDGAARYPRELEELLEDRRAREPVHHLRRLYLDPFTGQADWQIVREAQGGIIGVYSRSRRPALTRNGVPAVAAPDAEAADAVAQPPQVRVGDWRFLASNVPSSNKNVESHP